MPAKQSAANQGMALKILVAASPQLSNTDTASLQAASSNNQKASTSGDGSIETPPPDFLFR
jgi:hypothetical protein